LILNTIFASAAIVNKSVKVLKNLYTYNKETF